MADEETIEVRVDLTREEARWLIDEPDDDDRMGAFHTAKRKVEAAVREALDE